MTDETQLKQRYASLNAQRDMQQPVTAKGPKISAAAKNVPVVEQQSDSLVPRSASEQVAFEAGMKPPSARSSAIGKGLLKAVGFVWLVVREIFVMLFQRNKYDDCIDSSPNREQLKRQENDAIRQHDEFSSPSYSYLSYNCYHRPYD